MADCVCKYGLRAEVQTSWTDVNPAMRFYRCPQEDVSACSYFEFIDPRPTDMQRNYIAKLKRERDELKNELRLKRHECQESKESEEIAWDKAGLYIVGFHEMEEEMSKLKEEITKLKKKCWLGVLS